MLGRVVMTAAVFGVWYLLKGAVTRLEDGLYARLAVAVAGLRGALLGLGLALGGANLMTVTAGPIGQTSSYFALVALALGMLGVSFGLLAGIVIHLKGRR